MTWRLTHTPDKIDRHEYEEVEDVIGEWSDSIVEQSAHKVKQVYDDPRYAKTDEFDYDAVFEAIKEFLPDPIRDAL